MSPRSNPRPIAFDGTWDLETESWDKFVMGGIHTPKGGTETYDSPDACFDALMTLPKGTYWAHNSGRFDGLWFAGELLKRRIPWTGALRGSSIIAINVAEKVFRDSYAVFPEPLSVVAQTGGAEKIDVGLSCTCELTCRGYCSIRGVDCQCFCRKDCQKRKVKCACPPSCGGYCAIKRKMPSEQRSKVRDYLVHDVEGLQSGLIALRDYCAKSDIDLKTTIGSCAWNTCARWIGLDTSTPAHTLALYTEYRMGYYGGRTEPYHMGKRRHGSIAGNLPHGGNRYDIHSSYPAALSAIALPVGDIRSSNASQAYRDGHDGVYDAVVTVPECYSPPLPVRTADRLAYCFGTLKGTWTGIELRHAEACGAKIERIISGVYCEQSEQVLKPFADRGWGLRDKAKKEENDAIYKWVKWLINSLTGKLAMAPSAVSLACVDEDEGMKPGETRIMHKHGMLVLAREVERVSACAHVEWAAHLTSHARTELHRQLLAAGTDALYCDTDSVYTRGTLNRRIGDELGEWGHEGEMSDWQCLAPKVYRYWDPKKGKYIVRGKGMSRLDAMGFDELAEGKEWTVDAGVNTLRTAIRKGGDIFSRKTLSRKLAKSSGFVGSRRRVGDGTEAVDFAEYRLAHAA